MNPAERLVVEGLTIEGAMAALLAIERSDVAGFHDTAEHEAVGPLVLALREHVDKLVQGPTGPIPSLRLAGGGDGTIPWRYL